MNSSKVEQKTENHDFTKGFNYFSANAVPIRAYSIGPNFKSSQNKDRQRREAWTIDNTIYAKSLSGFFEDLIIKHIEQTVAVFLQKT
jgi:hypothetical protein